jgi:MerR family transcriptional regulator, light-induced transcriptional regulator
MSVNGLSNVCKPRGGPRRISAPDPMAARVSASPPIRIGELARRAGIPAATLRAWERRYGIVAPARSEGGYRLYGAEDEQRLRSMVGLIERGAAPAEAAQRVLAGEAVESDDERPATDADARVEPAELQQGLLAAIEGYDEARAQAVLDRAISAYSLEALIAEVVMPVLREVGERWAAQELSVGHEHFASNVIRGRLIGLARGWGEGAAPLALLACPPGEQHDIGLLSFGLLLRARGWRVAFLGADTPPHGLATAAAVMRPRVIVLALSGEEGKPAELQLGPLERAGLNGARLYLGGAGAREEAAARLGAEPLTVDVVAAATTVSERHL